jgi:hypothetical protein
MIVPGRKSSGEAALGAIEAELLDEKIQSLGRAGRAAQDALARLAGFDGEADTRQPLLDDAASRVWNFMIQCELCGFANPSAVIEDLDVPAEVVARLGVARRASTG